MVHTNKLDEIENIGKKIRQFLESRSHIIHGSNIRLAISEAEKAREYALLCTPTVVGRLLDAQKQLFYIRSISSSFDVLVKMDKPTNISHNDYEKLTDLLEEYNAETRSMFTATCSCKKQ